MEITPFPDGKPLTDEDIPAIMGVDPNCSAWTVWQKKSGRLKAPESPENPSQHDLAQSLKPAALAWGLANGQLGPNARAPKDNELVHPRLPLKVQPDFVLPESTAYGKGPGVGILVPVPYWEWKREWQSSRIEAQPPQKVYLRLQAMMMTLSYKDQPLTWSLAVAASSIDRLHPPIIVEANPDIQDTINDAILNFQEQMKTGNIPDPTERDMETINRIHHAKPIPDGTPWEPPAEIQDKLQRDIEDLAQATERARQAQAQADEMRRPVAILKARIAAECVGHGKVVVGDTLIEVTSKPDRPANPTATKVDVRLTDHDPSDPSQNLSPETQVAQAFQENQNTP